MCTWVQADLTPSYPKLVLSILEEYCNLAWNLIGTLCSAKGSIENHDGNLSKTVFTQKTE
jgi:hypothetical protein